MVACRYGHSLSGHVVELSNGGRVHDVTTLISADGRIRPKQVITRQDIKWRRKWKLYYDGNIHICACTNQWILLGEISTKILNVYEVPVWWTVQEASLLSAPTISPTCTHHSTLYVNGIVSSFLWECLRISEKETRLISDSHENPPLYINRGINILHREVRCINTFGVE